LVQESNGKISLTETGQNILTSKGGEIWEALRKELLKDEIIIEILQSIKDMSKEDINVRSSEDYYHRLSEVLREKYNFKSASPRALDRFITLFRKVKALDYDPFSNEYFIVRKHHISKDFLETILLEKYEQIKGEMIKKTGTSWVPVDLLRSRICREEGIETSVVNEFFKNAIERDDFQFAEASASRNEVRKGGIKKDDKIYFYVKIVGA